MVSEHNIHSDDEIELKKETAGIDDSVTGINELGSNEAEGNELLMHSANLYESTEDKYKDNLSSAITFLVCGAAGIIILILNDRLLHQQGSSNFILINIVLGLLFIGFIAIGFWSLKYSKNIKSKAAIESRDTDTILAWLKDNVSKDDIEASYAARALLELTHTTSSPTNDDLLDTIADKYIDNLFNE